MRNHLAFVWDKLSRWVAPTRKDSNRLPTDVREAFHKVNNKAAVVDSQLNRAQRDPHVLEKLAEAMQDRARDAH